MTDLLSPESSTPVGGGSSGRRRVAPFIAIAVAVVVAALFAVLASSSGNRSEAKENFYVGKPAPSILSSRLDGQAFDLSRRKGSWVVLNFFSTTCLPCTAEHPELVEFAEQQRGLGTNGAELYTIISQDTDDMVRTWFAERGGDWPVVRDNDGRIFVSLGVAQIPETFVIDPQGVVRAWFPGATNAATLSGLLQRLREGSAG